MLKVLLVEDSPTQALQIQLLLESAGHKVERAENGNDALGVLRKEAVDVVVTDLDMPQMSGLQLVEQMAKEFSSVPVILITVHGSEHMAVKALRCGAAAYVPKSMLDGMLCETIEEVMGVMRAERSYARLIESMDHCAMEFTLPCDVLLIDRLVDLINHAVAGMDLFSAVELIRASTAIEHALLNALYRGNLEFPGSALTVDHQMTTFGIEPEKVIQKKSEMPYLDRNIRVRYRVTRDQLRVTIHDDGRGFDTSIVPKAIKPEMLENGSGRGLLLMTSFMDEVNFNAKGNEVTLIKHKTPSGSR